MNTNCEDIMNDIIELDESVVVIIGISDIITISDSGKSEYSVFKQITTNSFYRIIGRRGDDDSIIDSLMNHNIILGKRDEVNKEGEYEFKAIFKWINECEWGRYENTTGYLELEHIEFKFIQTFIQRNRESILDDLMALNTTDDSFPF